MRPSTPLVLLVVTAAVAVSVSLIWNARRPAPAETAGKPASAEHEQIFDVRGKIISLDVHSGIVKIAHDEIPNYMPAMTMPFLVRDSNLLRRVQQGDMVKFKLAVTSDDSWISHIEQSSASVAAAAPPSAPEDDENRLKSGERVPPFGFVDQDDKERNISDFSGKFVALTFIYTRCPLPNFCPLLNRKFSELNDRLSKEFPGKYHLLSITIDPAYDTPQVLKAYSANYNADPSTWTFGTGTQEQITHIAQLFGLTFNEKNPGLIDHDMRTALIAPNGRLVHIWKSNFWTPYEIRNRIDEVIKGQEIALQR